jgi:hypothetical protein
MKAMRFGIAALFVALSLVMAFPARGADPADHDAWSITDVGRIGDLVVRIRVLKHASLADEDWLAIEFDNEGKSPIELTMPHYTMNGDQFDLATGTVSASGSLGSGNSFDMFPHKGPILIRPGVHRIASQPSDYSAALLGPPPNAGLKVKATLNLTFTVPRQGPFPDHLTSFEFEWLHPDDQGFERAKARLKRLLEVTTSKVEQAYMLHMLLGIPEVSRDVTPAQLLAAIERRNGPFSGRNYIAVHLADHFGQQPVVKRYYQDHLDAGEGVVIDDLRNAEKLWHTDFVGPLLAIFEKDPERNHQILTILSLHWGKDPDPAITRRLSTAILRKSSLLEKKPADLPIESRGIWAMDLKTLGETRDRELLPMLTPLLDDKTPLYANPDATHSADGRIFPSRVCDTALEAILTILDGTPDLAYGEAGGVILFEIPVAQRDDAMLKIRDKVIVKVKERLRQNNPR